MDTYRPLPGTPIEELDTPCLLVDLDAVEHNFSAVADMFRDSSAKDAAAHQEHQEPQASADADRCRWGPSAESVRPSSPRLR